MRTSTQADSSVTGQIALPPAPDIADDGLASLQARLHAIAVRHDTKRAVVAEFTQLLGELTGAQAVDYFARQKGERLRRLHAGRAGSHGEEAVPERQLARWCEEACRQGSVQVHSDEKQANRKTVCVPVAAGENQADALATTLLLGRDPVEPFVILVQLVASYVTFWHARHATAQLDWEVSATAAIIELQSKADSAEGVTEACFTIADELARALDCDQVAVGLERRRGVGCELQALSGMAELDHRSETARAIEAALDESVLRDGLTCWPPPADSERHNLLAHKRLAELLRAEAVVSSPLRTVEGEPVGAWLFVASAAVLHQQRKNHLIQAAAPRVATSLEVVRRAEGGRIRKLWRRIRRQRGRWQGRAALAAVLLTACVLLFPICYRIKCPCTAEPVLRRYAVAPHTGLLEKSFATPGAMVSEGDLLAVMDGRDIRWELAGLVAERNRAAKKRDASLAIEDVPEVQMARLEVERLDLKIRQLRRREEHLEIRSPIDGIVLAESLDRAESVPVTVGQALCEVGPLDPIEVELAVPDDEIAHVEPGMEVSVRFDAFPGDPVRGTISRLHPRSELRDAENVFVVEVELENVAQALRPGMRGRARIYARRHCLGWCLFHKPWDWAVATVGW